MKQLILGLFSLLLAMASSAQSVTLAVKLKPNKSISIIENAVQVEAKKTLAFQKAFPIAEPITSKSPNNFVDLSNIYQIELNNNEVYKVLDIISKEPSVIYAEILPIDEITLTPNDPDISQQYFLNIINAFSAYDKSTGDTSVVVAIVDTGTELDHPDLQGKLAYNYNDPIDGIDNDFDGYVDNYQGWDFANNDNDPSESENDHGVHVAGIAAAATNNSVGVAGVGFNTKYLPVKVGNNKSITHGYAGIVYAADQGADIINCSWGGSSYSQLANDVVNYATYNKGALVVGAAGNNGQEMMFFPAAYEAVMAVCATDQYDTKAAFSNYGYYIEIAAPGDRIYSTKRNGTYGLDNGTSMALWL